MVSGKKGGYYGCSAAHRNGTCTNKSLIAVSRVESSLLNLIKEKLTKPEVILFALKTYNHEAKSRLSTGPKRIDSIGKELGLIEMELANLVHMIISGNSSDTVASAIKERENKKLRLQGEKSSLVKSKEKTPKINEQGILERLEMMKRSILENPLSCFPIIRKMFPKKVKLSPQGKIHGGESLYQMKGVISFNDILEESFIREVTKNEKGEAKLLPLVSFNSKNRVSGDQRFDLHNNGVPFDSGDKHEQTLVFATALLSPISL